MELAAELLVLAAAHFTTCCLMQCMPSSASGLEVSLSLISTQRRNFHLTNCSIAFICPLQQARRPRYPSTMLLLQGMLQLLPHLTK